VQHDIACADHVAAARGAYKNTVANRQIHPATILVRSLFEALTLLFPMTRNKPKPRVVPDQYISHDVTKRLQYLLSALTSRHLASQTSVMAQTYLLFDFGSDEAKVQQARHKLESWKQAFRLDKKLQYKLEREETSAPESPAEAESEPAKTEKTKAGKAKSKSKAKGSDEEAANENHGPVKLLVRLYFSGHEKLSEQRWLDRIPTEEPFKSASPKIVRENEPEFADILSQFDTLE
jgi:hypothetical protein